MIHPERRRENLKKIEEMDKHDAESLQPDWKTWCMNKKVDMVEVVRCKDCKSNSGCGRGIYAGMVICYNTGAIHSPNWFCADGERKDMEHIETVCVNCKHDHHDANGCKAEPCQTCSNGWKGENFTENHFEPKEVR